MTYPPQQPQQQPGSWQDPSWPPPQPGPTQQPYADPYGGAPTSPGYGAPTSPSYAVPAGTPAYPAYGYGPAMPPPPKTNSLAIAAMVLALVGLGCGVSAPVGAIMGHVARRQIRQRGEGGDGMALAGIIVGWIVTGLYLAYIAFVVIMVIYAANHQSTSAY